MGEWAHWQTLALSPFRRLAVSTSISLYPALSTLYFQKAVKLNKYSDPRFMDV